VIFIESSSSPVQDIDVLMLLLTSLKYFLLKDLIPTAALQFSDQFTASQEQKP